MKGSSAIVLKAHLDHLDPSKRNRLLKFLPEKERQHIDSLAPADSEFTPVFETPKERIHPIHYSWMISPMEKFNKQEQALILSALEPLFGPTLSHALGIQPNSVELSNIAKDFIYSFMYKEVCNKRFVLPTSYLPASNMKILLRLNKNELIHLIKKLSLFDLAHEVKQIVETQVLKAIYSFLSEEERIFLKAIGSEADSFQWPKMGLDRWDRSKEHFQLLLHKRGIHRLSTAICTEGSDFMWHLSHRLDTGRGTLLIKAIETKPPTQIIENVQAQILKILESST